MVAAALMILDLPTVDPADLEEQHGALAFFVACTLCKVKVEDPSIMAIRDDHWHPFDAIADSYTARNVIACLETRGRYVA